MPLPPPPPQPKPKDPLFQRVEEWQAEYREEWFDRFAVQVMGTMLMVAVILLVIVISR